MAGNLTAPTTLRGFQGNQLRVAGFENSGHLLSNGDYFFHILPLLRLLGYAGHSHIFPDSGNFWSSRQVLTCFFWPVFDARTIGRTIGPLEWDPHPLQPLPLFPQFHSRPIIR